MTTSCPVAIFSEVGRFVGHCDVSSPTQTIDVLRQQVLQLVSYPFKFKRCPQRPAESFKKIFHLFSKLTIRGAPQISSLATRCSVVEVPEMGKFLNCVVIVAESPLGDPVFLERIRLGAEAPGRRVPPNRFDSVDRFVARAEDALGCTMMHELVVSGSNTALERLVAHLDADDVNRPDASGRTALWYAASRGLVNTTQVLLRAGADPLQVVNNNDNDATTKKSGNNSKNVVSGGDDAENEDADAEEARRLDAFNATNALVAAIDAKHDTVVDAICRHLRDANRQVPQEICNRFIASAPTLHQLAYEGDIDVLQFLTSHFLFQPYAKLLASKDHTGGTALHAAARGGSTVVVEFLIDKCGLHPDQPDSFGCAPIYYAAEHGHEAVVHSLVILGASVSRLSKLSRRSPLFVALANGHSDCAQELFKGLEAQQGTTTTGDDDDDGVGGGGGGGGSSSIHNISKTCDVAGDTIAALCAARGDSESLARLIDICGRPCVWQRPQVKKRIPWRCALPKKLEPKLRLATSLASQQQSSVVASFCRTALVACFDGIFSHQGKLARSKLECAVIIADSYANLQPDEIPETTEELVHCIATALSQTGSNVAVGFGIAKSLLSVAGAKMATGAGEQLLAALIATRFVASVQWLCECKVASDPANWKSVLLECARRGTPENLKTLLSSAPHTISSLSGWMQGPSGDELCAAAVDNSVNPLEAMDALLGSGAMPARRALLAAATKADSDVFRKVISNVDGGGATTASLSSESNSNSNSNGNSSSWSISVDPETVVEICRQLVRSVVKARVADRHRRRSSVSGCFTLLFNAIGDDARSLVWDSSFAAVFSDAVLNAVRGATTSSCGPQIVVAFLQVVQSVTERSARFDFLRSLKAGTLARILLSLSHLDDAKVTLGLLEDAADAGLKIPLSVGLVSRWVVHHGQQHGATLAVLSALIAGAAVNNCDDVASPWKKYNSAAATAAAAGPKAAPAAPAEVPATCAVRSLFSNFRLSAQAEQLAVLFAGVPIERVVRALLRAKRDKDAEGVVAWHLRFVAGQLKEEERQQATDGDGEAAAAAAASSSSSSRPTTTASRISQRVSKLLIDCCLSDAAEFGSVPVASICTAWLLENQKAWADTIDDNANRRNQQKLVDTMAEVLVRHHVPLVAVILPLVALCTIGSGGKSNSKNDNKILHANIPSRICINPINRASLLCIASVWGSTAGVGELLLVGASSFASNDGGDAKEAKERRDAVLLCVSTLHGSVLKKRIGEIVKSLLLLRDEDILAPEASALSSLLPIAARVNRWDVCESILEVYSTTTATTTTTAKQQQQLLPRLELVTCKGEPDRKAWSTIIACAMNQPNSIQQLSRFAPTRRRTDDADDDSNSQQQCGILVASSIPVVTAAQAAFVFAVGGKPIPRSDAAQSVVAAAQLENIPFVAKTTTQQQQQQQGRRRPVATVFAKACRAGLTEVVRVFTKLASEYRVVHDYCASFSSVDDNPLMCAVLAGATTIVNDAFATGNWPQDLLRAVMNASSSSSSSSSSVVPPSTISLGLLRSNFAILPHLRHLSVDWRESPSSSAASSSTIKTTPVTERLSKQLLLTSDSPFDVAALYSNASTLSEMLAMPRLAPGLAQRRSMLHGVANNVTEFGSTLLLALFMFPRGGKAHRSRLERNIAVLAAAFVSSSSSSSSSSQQQSSSGNAGGANNKSSKSNKGAIVAASSELQVALALSLHHGLTSVAGLLLDAMTKDGSQYPLMIQNNKSLLHLVSASSASSMSKRTPIERFLHHFGHPVFAAISNSKTPPALFSRLLQATPPADLETFRNCTGHSALGFAMLSRNSAKAEELLRFRPALASLPCFHDALPLVYAVQMGDEVVFNRCVSVNTASEISQMMVVSSPSSSSASSSSSPVVLIACAKGLSSIVEKLVSSGGSDIHATDSKGWTAPMLAAYNGHDALATSLVQNWHVAVVAPPGGGASSSSSSSSSSSGSSSLLHCAVWGGCETLVSWILSSAPQLVPVLDADGHTALQLSEALGRISITRRLHRASAGATAPPSAAFASSSTTGWFRNAMSIAARMLNTHLKKQVIAEHEFCLAARDRRVLSSATSSSSGGGSSSSSSSSSIADGALFSTMCRFGNTVAVRAIADFVGVDKTFALHAAAAAGFADICRLLLSLGCSNVMTVNAAGLTAFEVAVHNGKLAVAEYLFSQLVASDAAELFFESRIFDVLRSVVEASQRHEAIATLISRIAHVAVERNWAHHLSAALSTKTESYTKFAPLESALILGIPAAVMRLLAAQHLVLSQGSPADRRIVLSDSALAVVSSPLSCFRPSSRVLLFDVFGVHEASFREVDTVPHLNRLSFADVRLLGINALVADDYLRNCVENIFTVSHEAAVFDSIVHEPLGPLPKLVAVSVDWPSVSSPAIARCMASSLAVSRFRDSQFLQRHCGGGGGGGGTGNGSGSKNALIRVELVSDVTEVSTTTAASDAAAAAAAALVKVSDKICFYDTGRLQCISGKMFDFDQVTMWDPKLLTTALAGLSERATASWRSTFSAHPLLSRASVEFAVNDGDGGGAAADSVVVPRTNVQLSRCVEALDEAKSILDAVLSSNDFSLANNLSKQSLEEADMHFKGQFSTRPPVVRIQYGRSSSSSSSAAVNNTNSDLITWEIDADDNFPHIDDCVASLADVQRLLAVQSCYAAFASAVRALSSTIEVYGIKFEFLPLELPSSSSSESSSSPPPPPPAHGTIAGVVVAVFQGIANYAAVTPPDVRRSAPPLRIKIDCSSGCGGCGGTGANTRNSSSCVSWPSVSDPLTLTCSTTSCTAGTAPAAAELMMLPTAEEITSCILDRHSKDSLDRIARDLEDSAVVLRDRFKTLFHKCRLDVSVDSLRNCATGQNITDIISSSPRLQSAASSSRLLSELGDAFSRVRASPFGQELSGNIKNVDVIFYDSTYPKVRRLRVTTNTTSSSRGGGGDNRDENNNQQQHLRCFVPIRASAPAALGRGVAAGGLFESIEMENVWFDELLTACGFGAFTTAPTPQQQTAATTTMIQQRKFDPRRSWLALHKKSRKRAGYLDVVMHLRDSYGEPMSAADLLFADAVTSSSSQQQQRTQQTQPPPPEFAPFANAATCRVRWLLPSALLSSSSSAARASGGGGGGGVVATVEAEVRTVEAVLMPVPTVLAPSRSSSKKKKQHREKEEGDLHHSSSQQQQQRERGWDRVVYRVAVPGELVSTRQQSIVGFQLVPSTSDNDSSKKTQASDSSSSAAAFFCLGRVPGSAVGDAALSAEQSWVWSCSGFTTCVMGNLCELAIRVKPRGIASNAVQYRAAPTLLVNSDDSVQGNPAGMTLLEPLEKRVVASSSSDGTVIKLRVPAFRDATAPLEKMRVSLNVELMTAAAAARKSGANNDDDDDDADDDNNYTDNNDEAANNAAGDDGVDDEQQEQNNHSNDDDDANRKKENNNISSTTTTTTTHYHVGFDVEVWSEALYTDWRSACLIELKDDMWKRIAQRPSELENLVTNKQERALAVFARNSGHKDLIECAVFPQNYYTHNKTSNKKNDKKKRSSVWTSPTELAIRVSLPASSQSKKS